MGETGLIARYKHNRMETEGAGGGSEEKKEENGIYIVIENNRKAPKERYKKKAVKILSILHIVSGCLAVSVAGFMLILKSGYQRNEEPFLTVGEGLFCGLIFVITGTIGLNSIKRTTYCKITASLVLSIFSSLSGFIMIVISLATMHWSVYKGYSPGIASHILLVFCGLFELVLGIITSSFSCHACCGCCGAADGGRGGGNSVVYVPTNLPSKTDGEARVVHLNMASLQNSAQLTGKPPPLARSLTDQTILMEEKEEKEEKDKK